MPVCAGNSQSGTASSFAAAEGFDGGLRAPLPLGDKGFPQKNAGNGGFFVRKTTGRAGS